MFGTRRISQLRNPALRRTLTTLGAAATLLVIAGVITLIGCSGGEEGASESGTADGAYDTRETTVTNADGLEEPARRSPALRRSAESEAGRPGRWREASGTGERLTPEQLAEVKRLESIGYLSGSRAASGVGGVTIHDRARAGGGFNFYTSGHFPGALLVDMDGTVLHEWHCEFLTAFPGREDLVSEERTHHWRRAYLYPNGDILAIFEGAGIIKLDRESNLVWVLDNGAHHDLEVTRDGRIFVLTREAHIVPRVNQRGAVLEDFVTILNADGEELDRVSILEAFWDSDYSRALIALDMRRNGDITHTNTVEILDGTLADRIPAFARGNAFISFRKIDAIAVLDLDERKIVWLMAGPWIGQHQPTVLPNGNILVFDNGGETNISRVVEFDPVTQEEVWRYGGHADDGFYTKSCGSNALLPNGNVLITESDNGRAFEVTRDGEIVWEYRNPARAGDHGELIATLFEMVRLPEDFPLDWLDR